MKHGRIFENTKNDNAETVSINFYETEAGLMIKLLTCYISLGEEPTADYFDLLKK